MKSRLGSAFFKYKCLDNLSIKKQKNKSPKRTFIFDISLLSFYQSTTFFVKHFVRIMPSHILTIWLQQLLWWLYWQFVLSHSIKVFSPLSKSKSFAASMLAFSCAKTPYSRLRFVLHTPFLSMDIMPAIQWQLLQNSQLWVVHLIPDIKTSFVFNISIVKSAFIMQIEYLYCIRKIIVLK